MTVAQIKQPPFIKCGAINLRALTEDDIRQEYLVWLNDSDVLKWRGPKAFPTAPDDVRDYIAGTRGDRQLVLAIEDSETKQHVGNIALAHIQWVHRNAELNIMIGDATARGRGYGSLAICALAHHGFKSMGLHRLWAESPNPAFNGVMEKLGWRKEGVKRQAFLLDGAFTDVTCWSLLASDAQI